MTNKDKLNRFALAANSLRWAREALLQIQDAGGDFAPEAAHYKGEIDQLISEDDGAAGLDAIIRYLVQVVEKQA